jgi:hypothetical protein
VESIGIKMKRVVNGISYNTDTALRLGFDREVEMQGPTTLYQTKGGAFFLQFEMETSVWNESSRANVTVKEPIFRPIGPGHAKDWLSEKGVEVFHNPFKDKLSDTSEREPGGTLAVRVPATLKRAVEQAAKNAGISGNAWTMRCIERGVRDDELTQLLGTIAFSLQYLEDNDKRLKRADRIRIGRATMEALEAGWKRRFPDVPVDEMRAHVAEQWDEELEIHASGEPLA